MLQHVTIKYVDPNHELAKHKSLKFVVWDSFTTHMDSSELTALQDELADRDDVEIEVHPINILSKKSVLTKISRQQKELAS